MKKNSILLVEDNEGDILLTREALENGSFTGNIDVVRNGHEAVDYFNQILSTPGIPFPDLIFLDINLPKMNGQEVLQFVKGHPSLKHIPVVVLTTSSSEQDVFIAYQNGANCCITKPVDLNLFMEIIEKTENFWFQIVNMPTLKQLKK